MLGILSWVFNVIISNSRLLKLMAILCGIVLILAGFYHAGIEAERARNAALEAIKLTQYGQKILQLQTIAREQERASALKINQLTTQFNQRLNHVNAQKNTALRAVASGTSRLRIGTKTAVPACSGIASPTSPHAAAGAESASELSESAATFLINLAADCDTAAETLNLAIDVLQADRAAQPIETAETPVETVAQ